MTTKRLIISAILLSAVSYGIGNYAGKLTSSKEDSSKSKEKDKEHIIIIETPGKTITEIIRERERKEESKHKEIAQTERSIKLSVSALIAGDIHEGLKPTYGIAISREILGPFTAGGFILNNGTIGLSLGMNF